MSTLLCRKAGQIARIALYSSVRASSHEKVDPHKGKVESNLSMPDSLGHSVGIERYELLANLAGNEDPFELNIQRRANGTFDEPTLIPSVNQKRLVGCICEEDAVSINWMNLAKGEPKRCHCGYWFKLVEVPHADYGA